MHAMNVQAIIFKGKEGKKAIKQILNAKPVKNEYTTTVNNRSEEFVKNINLLLRLVDDKLSFLYRRIIRRTELV